jgi:hypothetical protein
VPLRLRLRPAVFTLQRTGTGHFPEDNNRITIEIPRLSTFIGDTSGLELKLEAQMYIPARRLPRNPDAPAETPLAEAVGKGTLNAAVLDGAFPEPESTDALGKSFRFHAPSGTVRSEGLAALDARRTLGILRAGSAKFRSDRSRFASSLDEMAAFFVEWMSQGKSLQQTWTEVFKDGRSPAHPLAAWGESYIYDPKTGSVHTTWPEKAKPQIGTE